jgi:hypothetical protein
MDSFLLEILKIIVLSSIFFVWVIRYNNIVEEFKVFHYPSWLRDLVGIFKLSFAVMLLNPNTQIIRFGAAGIIFLMFAALLTHIKIKNPIFKMLPSFSLFCSCLYIFLET